LEQRFAGMIRCLHVALPGRPRVGQRTKDGEWANGGRRYAPHLTDQAGSTAGLTT
jgi:hypothetical protein